MMVHDTVFSRRQTEMLTERYCKCLRTHIAAQRGNLIDQEIVERQQIGSMFHPEIAKDLAKCFSVSLAKQS